jgi:hypothetical protein
MDPFARIAETHHEMSAQQRHLQPVESPGPEIVMGADTAARPEPGSVALLHEWRAARIARSKAMHPSTLARAATTLRPLN